MLKVFRKRLFTISSNRRRFLIFSILMLCFGRIATMQIGLLAQDQGLESGILLWFQM